MDEWHVSFMEARKNWLEQQRIHREIERLKEEKSVLREKEQLHLTTLHEEKDDVEKLERMSLTNLFVTMTGKKSERIEKEKQEVVEARLKWREAHQSLADVEKEMEHLEEDIQQLGDVEGEYNRLYRRKKQFLISQGERKGKRLLEISEQRSEIQAELGEIWEALEAGKMAMSALEEASKSLTSAENWGALDMLGGGMLTTAVKHTRVDDADTAIHTAQRHLRKFANELNDLGEHYGVNIDIPGGWMVADYFFDGLIVDWFVQNRIQSSHEEVRKIRRKTHEAFLDLEALHQQFEKKEANMKEDMDRIVRKS